MKMTVRGLWVLALMLGLSAMLAAAPATSHDLWECTRTPGNLGLETKCKFALHLHIPPRKPIAGKSAFGVY